MFVVGCVPPPLTVLRLGSQLLYSLHAVDVDVVWVTRLADGLVVHVNDVFQVWHLSQRMLYRTDGSLQRVDSVSWGCAAT